MKNFDEWNKLKKNIEKRSYIPPEIIESGQVYWFSFGLNIGKEIGGKNESFTRPAMIYKVITKTTFLVIPITTSENYNDEWHMSFINHRDTRVFLCFNQTKVMDFRRMKNYMYSLNQIDLSRAIDQFENLFYIRTATVVAGDRDRRSDASAVALTNIISDQNLLSNQKDAHLIRKVYNKLVRDRMVDIWKGEEGTQKQIADEVKYKYLNRKDILEKLKDKIYEETQEVIYAYDEADKTHLKEELGDLIEVIDAILHHNSISLGEVLKIRDEKKKIRGGFEEGLYLEWIDYFNKEDIK